MYERDGHYSIWSRPRIAHQTIRASYRPSTCSVVGGGSSTSYLLFCMRKRMDAQDHLTQNINNPADLFISHNFQLTSSLQVVLLTTEGTEVRTLSQGQPLALAHCNTSRCPPAAASLHVDASHGQPARLAHLVHDVFQMYVRFSSGEDSDKWKGTRPISCCPVQGCV